MTNDEKLQIALQALKDIVDPIGSFQRGLKNGEAINGLMAIKLSEDHNYLKEIAQKALIAIQKK